MKTVTGDLIALAKDGTFDVIVHGCNCFCTMGAGIAPKIADAFAKLPNTFDVYVPASAHFTHKGPREVDNLTVRGSVEKLGTCSFSDYIRKDGSRLFIVNAYTQYGIAKEPGECVVDYEAVQKCFQQIAKLFHTKRIGYPAIGAGLGGGDWNRIKQIIDAELDGIDHTLIQYIEQSEKN